MTSWRGGAARALPYAPVAGMAAYAVVLLARWHSLVHDTATSDSVGPMVIAQSLPAARPGSTVVMGNAANYTWLWFDQLTRHLPGYRAIWEVAPYLLALLGLVLLARTVRRLAGDRAEVMTLAIGIATPPLVLVPLLHQAFHDTTFVNGIALSALLVLFAASPDLRSRRVVFWGALAAVVTGLDLASDTLLLVSGVLPLAGAALLMWWRNPGVPRSRDVAVAASAVSVGAIVVAVAVTGLMHLAGYRVEGLSLGVADAHRAQDSASLFWHLLLDMANGRLSLHDLGYLGPLRLVCGVLVVGAVLVPVVQLVMVTATGRAPRAATVDPAVEPTAGIAARRAQATGLFLAYWGLVTVLVALAFVGSTLPVDRNSMRYLLPIFYAVAATVPLATVRLPSRSTLVGAGVGFVGVTGAVLLAHAGPDDFDVQPQHEDGLIAALESHGLHRGYAGYWQANLLTWESDGRVISRAVHQDRSCHPRVRGWFCPYPIFTISDWYRPSPGAESTFVIREIGGAFVGAPPPPVPRPVAVFSYDRFEVYVYDHDVGADAARTTTGWDQTSTP